MQGSLITWLDTGHCARMYEIAGMRIRHFFPRIRIRLGKKCGSGWIKIADPDPTLNRNEEKNIFIFQVGRHKIRHYKP